MRLGERLVFPLTAIGIWLVASLDSRAADARLATALACPGSIAGPDCSRDTAVDVVSQPASATDCPKVVQVLATHLDLPAGGYHKLICERRKG